MRRGLGLNKRVGMGFKVRVKDRFVPIGIGAKRGHGRSENEGRYGSRSWIHNKENQWFYEDNLFLERCSLLNLRVSR